jgi:hypothetical protein
VDRGGGDALLGVALEEVLGRPLMELKIRGQTRGELDDLLVEQGRADLEGAGHGHPVHILTEQLA